MSTIESRLAKLETAQQAATQAAEFCQCQLGPRPHIRVIDYRAGLEREDDAQEICEQCGWPIDAISIRLVYGSAPTGG